MGGHHDPASGPLAVSAVGLAREETSADTLSDVLQAVRLTGALFFLVDASTPWVAEAPPGAKLAPVLLPRVQHVVSYHVITRGACWCESPGQQPVRLDTGDVIVIPHGHEYVLTSDPGLRAGLSHDEILGWFRGMALGHLPLVVKEGGGGPQSIGVLCGFLGCDALPFNPVLATLPALLHVRPPHGGGSDRLGGLIELAINESRDKQAGTRSVLLRIGELLFVEVVRRYLSTLSNDAGGWLGGLRDPIVGHALALLHERPAHAWTLEELARQIGTSRSVLTERFTRQVGQPPMHYLTAWRMQVAAGLLADSRAKVSAVAWQVGYQSEAAFSRAFKGVTGVAPAVWRNR